LNRSFRVHPFVARAIAVRPFSNFPRRRQDSWSRGLKRRLEGPLLHSIA
jgi:hypothetical protein